MSTLPDVRKLSTHEFIRAIAGRLEAVRED